MMLRWFHFLVLSVVLLSVSFIAPKVQANAGGWVSSGGELFRFGKNPWFLKNVTSVDYCVVVDTATVSAPVAVVQDVVREAIAYWKNEFKDQAAMVTNGFAAVGTQTFNEVPCNSSLALQFRIGFGALDKEEVAYLDDPLKFVGVSIRKDYDNEQMRGKGIVFIASDKGPNAYSAKPNSGHLLPEAWKERRLLLYALIHEMGHVFGIPHTGSGLMSEVFLEQLLHKRFYQFYLDNPVSPFLLAPLVLESCSPFGSFNASFFQVPLDAACIRMEGKLVASSYEWAIFYRKSLTSAPVAAGSVKASTLSTLAISAKPAAVIQLPTEQKVFSLQERQMNSFLIGPVFSESTARGFFTTAISSRPYDVQVELRPDSIVMTGLVGGHMMPVFVYSPPSLLTQIFPVGP